MILCACWAVLVWAAWAAASRTATFILLLNSIPSIPILLLWGSTVGLGPGPWFGLGSRSGTASWLAAWLPVLRLALFAVMRLSAWSSLMAPAARAAASVSGSRTVAAVSWSRSWAPAPIARPRTGVTVFKEKRNTIIIHFSDFFLSKEHYGRSILHAL